MMATAPRQYRQTGHGATSGQPPRRHPPVRGQAAGVTHDERMSGLQTSHSSSIGLWIEKFFRSSDRRLTHSPASLKVYLTLTIKGADAGYIAEYHPLAAITLDRLDSPMRAAVLQGLRVGLILQPSGVWGRYSLGARCRTRAINCADWPGRSGRGGRTITMRRRRSAMRSAGRRRAGRPAPGCAASAAAPRTSPHRQVVCTPLSTRIGRLGSVAA